MSGSALRFLADESCDFAVVRALRARGYDVAAVSELAPGGDAHHVIELADREGRVLLTEDKDFGWLVFVSEADSAGVVLMRFPGHAREALARTVTQLVCEQGERLQGTFCMMQPGRTRISRKPGP